MLGHEFGSLEPHDLITLRELLGKRPKDVRRFLRDKGLDILPHRQRIVREQLDEKFKNPDDPLRIVFVCAMWMTGFDVPSL